MKAKCIYHGKVNGKAVHIEKPIYHRELSFTTVKKAQVWSQPFSESPGNQFNNTEKNDINSDFWFSRCLWLFTELFNNFKWRRGCDEG